MTILQRALASTPRFFKRLRMFGFILSALSGVGLLRESGAVIQEVATHIATAGAILMAVSQVTVDDEALKLIQHNKERGINGK